MSRIDSITTRSLWVLWAGLALILAVGLSRAEGNPVGPRLAVQGFDPVALTAGDHVEGKESIALDHDGFRYLFQSAASRSAFQASPERYGIQFAGECATMRGVPGNPENFAVHDGKIYIFGSTNCRSEFLQRPVHFTERKTMNVAVVLYDGVELLDFAGPGEVFAAAHGGGNYEVYTVASSREPIVSQGFVSINPAQAMNDSLRPDILIIPGGNSGNLTGDEAAMKWIADAVAEADHVLTVCTGAAALAKIGALDGLEATTHHGAIDGLRKMAPKAKIHDDRRFVDNGKIITTAGVSAGIDGALHLLRRLDGTEAAVATARYMEYDWQQERDDVVIATQQR